MHKYMSSAIVFASLLILGLDVAIAYNKPGNAQSYNTGIAIMTVIGFSGLLFGVWKLLICEGGRTSKNEVINRLANARLTPPNVRV